MDATSNVKHCTKCLTNERVLRQRWCKSCRATYQQSWRKEQTRKLRLLREITRTPEAALARLRTSHTNT